MGKTFTPGKPPGYNKSFSDLNVKDTDHNPPKYELNSPLPEKDINDPFKNPASFVKPISQKDNPNAVINFETASSNPMDIPLPFEKSYAEFPASKVNDSKPRAKFQDKADKVVIEKGNPRTAQDTGQAHS